MTEDDRIDVRRAWDKALWEGGFAGLMWPVEFGGQGLGAIEQIIFYEEAARAHAPQELDIVGKVVAGPSIVAHGTSDQKSRFLRAILSGDEVWCEGFSEPEAGSDLAAVRTLAVRDGRGYRVRGRKTWTTHAHFSDRCYVLAKTSETAPRHHNLSVLMVDMHQPGIEVTPIRELTGGAQFNEVVFNDVWVDETDRLGEHDQGWPMVSLLGFRRENHLVEGPRRYAQLSEWLTQLRICAGETGGDEAAADDLAVSLELLKWQVRRAAELMDARDEWFSAASIIHVYWTELMQRIARTGLELGCPQHLSYWRYQYFDSLAATIYGGSSQIQRNVIADAVLRLPR